VVSKDKFIHDFAGLLADPEARKDLGRRLAYLPAKAIDETLEKELLSLQGKALQHEPYIDHVKRISDIMAKAKERHREETGQESSNVDPTYFTHLEPKYRPRVMLKDAVRHSIVWPTSEAGLSMLKTWEETEVPGSNGMWHKYKSVFYSSDRARESQESWKYLIIYAAFVRIPDFSMLPPGLFYGFGISENTRDIKTQELLRERLDYAAKGKFPACANYLTRDRGIPDRIIPLEGWKDFREQVINEAKATGKGSAGSLPPGFNIDAIEPFDVPTSDSPELRRRILSSIIEKQHISRKLLDNHLEFLRQGGIQEEVSRY
jgi:hypothetical protein